MSAMTPEEYKDLQERVEQGRERVERLKGEVERLSQHFLFTHASEAITSACDTYGCPVGPDGDSSRLAGLARGQHVIERLTRQGYVITREEPS